LSCRLAGADCLAGCTTVGPDYHLPDKAAMQRPAAQAGFANVDGKLTSAQPVASRWWQLYHDPVLNQLVESTSRQYRFACCQRQSAKAWQWPLKCMPKPARMLPCRHRQSGRDFRSEHAAGRTAAGDQSGG
jgi:hypothetical protein